MDCVSVREWESDCACSDTANRSLYGGKCSAKAPWSCVTHNVANSETTETLLLHNNQMIHVHPYICSTVLACISVESNPTVVWKERTWQSPSACSRLVPNRYNDAHHQVQEDQAKEQSLWKGSSGFIV